MSNEYKQIIEKEETLAYIAHERDSWLDLRRRVGRTAGLDAELNAAYHSSNTRMDFLLEDLFRQTVLLETGALPSVPILEKPVPAQGYEPQEYEGA